MAKIDLTSWLPNLLGPLYFFLNGTEVDTPRRKNVNLKTGDALAVEDDPDNDMTNIVLPAGGGTPTIQYVNTTTSAANQVLDDGTTKTIPANSITKIDVDLFVKKDGAAAGGLVQMSGVYLRNGSSAPVRVAMSCPCASGLGATAFTKLTSDVSRTANSYADLITQSITTTGGDLQIFFNFAGKKTTSAGTAYFKLVVDGVDITGADVSSSGGYLTEAAIVWQMALSAGAHTVKVQWKVDTSGVEALCSSTPLEQQVVIASLELPTGSSESNPVQYTLSGSTLDGSTANLNINGNNVEVRVSPETAETLHWGVSRAQTSALFSG